MEFADGTKMVGMGADADGDGVSDVNSSVITADKAYELMENELDEGKQHRCFQCSRR